LKSIAWRNFQCPVRVLQLCARREASTFQKKTPISNSYYIGRRAPGPPSEAQ
jgi:hypothetical protein